MIDELSRVFTHEILALKWVVVFQGSKLKDGSGMFCAGGDLNWMKRSIELTYEENLKDTRSSLKCLPLWMSAKPVIGVVEGEQSAAGRTVSICDIVLAQGNSI